MHLEGEYDPTRTYSALSIVTSENSIYVSKRDVPVGVTLSDETYWRLSARADDIEEPVPDEDIEPEIVQRDITVILNQLGSAVGNLSDYYTKSQTDESIENVRRVMVSHTDNRRNPHIVTKNQLGLSNVDNTSDLDKPISTAQQIALDNKFDDAYADEEGYLVLAKGDETIRIGPFAGGGGGGGGNNATLSLSNTSGFLAKSVSRESSCILTATWSSLENGLSTGSGTLTIKVGGAVKTMVTAPQGNISVDVKDYLNIGSNTVKLSISDVYANTRTLNFTINVIALTLTSTFDSSVPYSGAVSFPYVPTGAASKTMHISLDGTEVSTPVITESGRQQTYIIPAQEHGTHSLEVYFEADIDNDTVRSNVLYYDIMFVEAGNNDPVIASDFRTESVEQYMAFSIPFYVFDPASLVAAVTLEANGELVQSISVDRTIQNWVYTANATGTLILTISCGDTTKTFTLDVTESTIDVAAVTQDLELYLSAQGRSNGEAAPSVWSYENIASQLTGFQFVSDGWKSDADGNTMLRVQGNARVTIPLLLFQNDFRTTGKTIEIEFATSNVTDYEDVIISCWSGNRGIKITPQQALFASEQVSIETQYKENEHVRMTFIVEKRLENHLIYVYLNGVMCGAVQYPDDDDFSQQIPVGISIGSNNCTTDIYCIRVYSNDLTRIQALNNWIADTQSGALKKERYERNNIYDEYGAIVINRLPNDLPVMIWDIPILPTFKGDKRNTNAVSYDDIVNPAQSFEAGTCQMNVQGTSSQYYYRKNFKLKFSTGLTINGEEATKYALREGAIPEKEFTLKADVASSEGCNNVELVRLYNDASKANGILTPPQQEDSRCRVGIDGFPMVCFHNDGTSTYFYGKFNFNNDKGNESTFGFSEGDESWEIKNNTSNRVLFKSADFTGDDWLNDFEARYPDTDPVYVDSTKLAAVWSWVVSTDRDAATDEELEETYTDSDGNEYTIDSEEYRLAKFKTEIEDWFDLDSSMFYYLFTELFLMVDSRAKNAFPTYWHETGKWFWLPYDFDTALGINNEGALVFGYSLEDIDTVDGALVFNGQTSTFWCNLRDAFHDELAALYTTLRGQAYLNYDYVEGQFEAHQAKWPEAIFNEDSYSKCLEPLILNNDATYLEMLQGSKAEQRKWWLYNRFRYIDSKYNAGDAKSDYIQLRGYSKDSITITPYADVYASVLYGSYLVQTRALRGSSYTLDDPLDSVNDTEILVFSASQLKSVGDLSGLKVGLCDLSRATKLQSVKLGDSSAEYTNPNLRTLTFGNNALLKTIDCRNCINLGTGVTSAPDISGCVGVEEVYFDGTAITGITLPNGGMIKKLHLPETISNLTVLNQVNITDFQIAGTDNISTLRVENTPALDDSLNDIITGMATGGRVRLLGISWTLSSSAILDKLLTMRGLDENGNNTAMAVLSGEAHVSGSLSLATALQCEEDFRYLTVTSDTYLIDILLDNQENYVYDSNGDVVIPEGGGHISKFTTAQIDEFIAFALNM